MEIEKNSADLRAVWALFEAPFHATPAPLSIEALTASEEHAQRAFELAGPRRAAFEQEYDALWQNYLTKLSRPEHEALLAAFVRGLIFYPYEGKEYRLVRELFMQGYAESQEKILSVLRALPISRHAADFLEAGFREGAAADKAIKVKSNDIAPQLLRRALDTGEASIGTPLFVLYIHRQYALLCRGFFSYELNEMDFKDLHLNRNFELDRCIRAL